MRKGSVASSSGTTLQPSELFQMPQKAIGSHKYLMGMNHNHENTVWVTTRINLIKANTILI